MRYLCKGLGTTAQTPPSSSTYTHRCCCCWCVMWWLLSLTCRKDANHKTTPTRVLFRVRCVQWEAFVEKVGEEETLLVMLTAIKEVNKH